MIIAFFLSVLLDKTLFQHVTEWLEFCRERYFEHLGWSGYWDDAGSTLDHGSGLIGNQYKQLDLKTFGVSGSLLSPTSCGGRVLILC